LLFKKAHNLLLLYFVLLYVIIRSGEQTIYLLDVANSMLSWNEALIDEGFVHALKFFINLYLSIIELSYLSIPFISFLYFINCHHILCILDLWLMLIRAKTTRV